VYLFPFGVSFGKFEQVRQSADQTPSDLAALKRPVVGYVGGIHQWMDLELLAAAARQMPDTSFVLVGPLQMDVSATHGVPNLHLLGKRPHDDIPRYIKGFDVGIVPYVLSEYTANVYPTKLN
jgi:glycosyltransferase involved in cell wall biosynthesis